MGNSRVAGAAGAAFFLVPQDSATQTRSKMPNRLFITTQNYGFFVIFAQFMRKFALSLLLLLAGAFGLQAQFYSPGTDPGRLRWYTMDSPYYRVIYPEGADSLARSYLRLMEQFREPVGRSINYTPQNARWGKQFPIVLHTHHLTSNGSVAFAPTRMDFYTTPEFRAPNPASWAIELASHEPRHQAQLEKIESAGLFKGLTYVIGQGSAPLGWILYLAAIRGEGDAVAVETGLVPGTRARTADFLNYMQVAFDQGDWRSLTRWSKGSYKHYTPDYYKAGYMLMGGMRYLYSAPLFTAEGMEKALNNPLLIAPYDYSKVIRKLSGKFPADAFKDIMHTFNDVWQADAAARAPFIDLGEPVTPAESFPLNYSSSVWADGTLYALREGYLRTSELVSIRNGRIHKERTFSSQTSRLTYDPVRGRIYWTEIIPHIRWSLDGTSAVRYLDLKTRRTRDLAPGQRYFNPSPSPDGSRVAVVESAVTGETYAVVLSADDGSVLQRQMAPEGIQLTESAWVGEELYFLGLSQEGFGLYKAFEGWVKLLAPTHQKVVNLESADGCLEWVSDRTGVNERYRFNPADGKLLQLTSTRYGATDFREVGDTLYCVSQTLDGKLIFSVPSASQKPREVRYEDLHTYTIEDAITAQEQALGPGPDFSQEVPLSAPKRYYKLLHPLRLHTWAPLYADADAIMNGSFEFSYQNVSPGVTGFFQNTLGTFSGQLGAAIHPDPDKDEGWRGAFHAMATYNGRYPVFEVKVDVGDRRARQYNYTELYRGDKMGRLYTSSLRDRPLFNGTFRAYVPLASRKGGILYGFIPQFKYTFSNNVYCLTPVKYESNTAVEGLIPVLQFKGSGVPQNVFMQQIGVSARGYVMLPTAKSSTYPRWGIGLEGGVSLRPFTLTHFRPVVYGYTYAYLPGLWRTQGLKLTGTLQHQLGDALFGDISVAVLPRGFNASANSYISNNYRTQWRITADYAIPIYVGDLAVPALGYIRYFQLSPHGDFTGLGKKDFLWSAGADLVANMGEIFFLSTNTNLGVSFSWLGGSVYENTEQKKPYSVSLILSFDF